MDAFLNKLEGLTLQELLELLQKGGESFPWSGEENKAAFAFHCQELQELLDNEAEVDRIDRVLTEFEKEVSQ